MAATREQHAAFWRILGADLKGGRPLLSALDHAKTRLAGTDLEGVAADLNLGIQGGSTLSEAMGRHETVFSRSVRMMVRAGEAGGVLDVIAARIAEGIQDYARSMKPGDVPAVVVDAALIVDVGAATVFDMIVVVVAAAEERVRRMVQLRGMDEAEARARIASQVPDEERVEHAQLVIVNDGTFEELKAKVGEAWERIKAEAFSREK